MDERYKIAVLTYTFKHRKTYDVLSLLKANGYSDVVVCAIPPHYQKKQFPIYQHRPEMNYEIPELETMCDNMSYEYKSGSLDSFGIESDRIVLIAGAGIIDNEFISTHTVINAHPGYIPECRGLDSFKWAIVDNKPIGVTTHLLGEYVDAGLVIERRTIPVHPSDTFHSLAQRVYENEVSMLIEAIKKVDPEYLTMIIPDDDNIHRRMPKDIEEGLMEAFERYKEAHSS